MMELLRRLPLFRTLDDEELALIASGSTRLEFRQGAMVVAQGGEAEALYGVLRGRLKVGLVRARGVESVVTVLGPQDVFGELALFEDRSRSAQVTTLERAELLRVGHATFKRVLARSPRLGIALSELLAGRVRAMARHFEDVTGQPVALRLARKVVLLAPPSGGELGLSQQELAELCETSRQSVNRWLRAWERQGLVEGAGRRLRVRQFSRLRELGAER